MADEHKACTAPFVCLISELKLPPWNYFDSINILKATNAHAETVSLSLQEND